ncbi:MULTISPECIES: DUF6090 family protein [Maribacter]|uniref:DUF6090 family protein n=1 Tax=Maribacter flavus TaxID=1658664 RepID=A0ABU7IN14_9FLAO|nr:MULTISPECIES: DUF6090 family protein [Maribacter]MDC6407144.1 DUF6090 family protein [Maribacter sp. PR66]MEE1974280.1 DUF6090 family protein [Maribacter flavus]
MIKFFRKIRQNVLSQGKTGKYLKYAFGEILLVVIGILIALQVSNWNKKRIDSDSEKEALFDLNTEIKSNIKALEIIIAEHEKSLVAGKKIKSMIIDTNMLNSISNDSLKTILIVMNYNYTYDPKLGILNSVINSGKINLIQNKDIRYMLSSINELIIDANESTKVIEKLRGEYYWPMIASKREIVDYNKLTRDNKTSFRNPEFVWWVDFNTTVRQEGLDEEYELLEFLKKVNISIESEIKK